MNVLCNKSLLISYQRGLPYVDVKEINHSTLDCYEMLGCINRSDGQNMEKNTHKLLCCMFFSAIIYGNI